MAGDKWSGDYTGPKKGSVDTYTRFTQDYFAGSNVSIYFDRIWVDEVQTLSFMLQENVQPIYGYASYTADAFAKGNRIVQGQFSINFKEAYYLKAIMNSLEYIYQNGYTGNVSKLSSAYNAYNNMTNAGDTRMTIEEILGFVSNSDKERLDTFSSYFQTAVWGDAASNHTKNPNLSSADAKGVNQMKYAVTDPDDTYFSPRSKANLREKGFDIVITYGNVGQDIKQSMKYKSTTKTINGIHLTGCSQVLAPNGDPVQEVYSFIAKDLDGFTYDRPSK